MLEAEAHGDELPPPPCPPDATDDAINAWFQERTRGQPADAVLARTAERYDRLARVVMDVPIERLDDPAAFPSLEGRSLAGAILGGAFFGHLHEEHEPDIRRWLAAGTRSGVAGARGGML